MIDIDKIRERERNRRIDRKGTPSHSICPECGSEYKFTYSIWTYTCQVCGTPVEIMRRRRVR